MKKQKPAARRPAKLKSRRTKKPAPARRIASPVKTNVQAPAKPSDLQPVIPRRRIKVAEKKKLREILIRLREKITGQINFLAKDNLNRTKDDVEIEFRSEEQGTDNFDRDFALNRVSSEQEVVFEIDEALNRLQIDSYGLCEKCVKPIEKARLAALPYTRMCKLCQSQAESGRKKFRPFEAPALFPSVDKTSADVATDDE